MSPPHTRPDTFLRIVACHTNHSGPHFLWAMNWEKVNEFVLAWAAQQPLPADFNGRTLTLVDFENEADCEFFYPGRTLLGQKAFTSALAKLARSRHAKTEHITINRDHYQHWLLAEKGEDTDENRARFIESRYKVLTVG